MSNGTWPSCCHQAQDHSRNLLRRLVTTLTMKTPLETHVAPSLYFAAVKNKDLLISAILCYSLKLWNVCIPELLSPIYSKLLWNVCIPEFLSPICSKLLWNVYISELLSPIYSKLLWNVCIPELLFLNCYPSNKLTLIEQQTIEQHDYINWTTNNWTTRLH